MKYETPKLTVLPSAINGIQVSSAPTKSPTQTQLDISPVNDAPGAYLDWE